MYFIADLHGNINPIINWTDSLSADNCNIKCSLVVLGDAGINYFSDEKDFELKKKLQEQIDLTKKKKGVCIDILFVRGNHEIRPENIKSYDELYKYGGKVYVENNYPNLIFLKDGEIYIIEDSYYFVLGGGFSSDFFNRLLNNYGIWRDQELSSSEFREIFRKAKIRIPEKKVNILTHMLPEKAIEKFVSKEYQISNTENYLQEFFVLYNRFINNWYCGHYHKEKNFKINACNFYVLYNKVFKP